MAFPADPLDVVVEIDLGSGWEDITQYAYLRDEITITRGTPDEATTADPAQFNVTLNNRDGRFSARNPLSPYYGRLGRNTPMRVTVEGSVRIVGEVSAWPTRWDVSGNDEYVPVQGSGILRRLGQGQAPLRSAMTRAVLAETDLIAWWPLEDNPGSTQAATPYPGQPPMDAIGNVTFTGQPSGGMGGGASFGEGGRLVGRVVGCPAEWAVAVWFDVPADMPADGVSPVVQWTLPGSTTMRNWSLFIGSGAVGFPVLEVADADGNVTAVDQYEVDYRGQGPTMVHVSLVQSSPGNSVIDFRGDITTSGIQIPMLGSPVAPIVSIGANSAIAAEDANFSGTISHLIVNLGLGSWPNYFNYPAARGYVGERAADRIERLCTEENVAIEIIGDPDESEPLGPQRPAKFLELLGEAAQADDGRLGEQRDAIGLTYRTRADTHNTEPDLTVAYGDLAPPLEPTPDDQRVRNDITAERRDGSLARAVLEEGTLSIQPPPDGVGIYDEGVTLNVAEDTQLPDQAGWRLWRGTWDEDRYPVVHLDLAAKPALIADAVTLDSRSHLRITGMPPGVAPGDVDLLVEGYEETLHTKGWDILLNSNPQGPWRVGVLDDDVLGRLDTAGSVLAADVTTNGTTLLVATAEGPAWTTDPADAPFDIQVGGEIAAITAVGDGVSDGFDRTTANGWGSAPDGQAWTVTGTASNYSTTSSEGRITITATNVARVAALDQQCDAVDVEMAFKLPVAAFTGSAVFLYLVGSYDQVANDWYALVIILNTDGTMSVFFEIKTAGVTAGLNGVTVVPGVTVSTTATYRARFRVQEGLLQGKLWNAASPEPAEWHTVFFDSTHTGGGDVGVQVFIPATVSNALPLVFAFPELVVHNPQKLTATRAVNGVAKAHAAGADVRLAQPMILAM